MNPLKFEQIGKENWEACCELSVLETQKDFVATNWYSILQAQFESDLHPVCFYDEDVLVGFLMYGLDPDTNRMEMCRLMVDQSAQGKGYGKQAIIQLLDIIKAEYGPIPFYTSIEPENKVAGQLYGSVGFNKTGEIMWDEEIMMIQL